MTAWWRRVSRVTPIPLALRVVIFLATLAGLWLAAPEQASTGRPVFIMAFIALLPAFAVGTRVIDAIMVGIVITWVATTLSFDEPAEPLRVFGVATALYVLHSSAALAAALPYDAVVDPQVPLRWLARSALVIAAAGVVAAAVVLIAPLLTPTTSMIALLAGVAIAVGTVAVLSAKRL